MPIGDTDSLLDMFDAMMRIRKTEEVLADLCESGEVGCPCHLYIGQEAIAVGVCAALDERDSIWGGHRSHGHYLAKGGSLEGLLAEVLGKSTGCTGGRGGSMHLLARDVGLFGTVPLVSATIPLSVGAALSSKMTGTDAVAVSFFGDGAVEEGHFHESVNLASLMKLPVVFVCENNFYASHMALLERRAKDNIAQIAEGHGIPGLSLDGNDVQVVLEAARAAVGRARAGEGPTLLECRTYRWRGHVGPSSDMDVGVKRKDELADWIERDPITRARRQLLELGVEGAHLDAMALQVHEQVFRALETVRKDSEPEAHTLGDHVFTRAGV